MPQSNKAISGALGTDADNDQSIAADEQILLGKSESEIRYLKKCFALIRQTIFLPEHDPKIKNPST